MCCQTSRHQPRVDSSPLTVRGRVLAARHDAVAQLDDLGHADDALAVVLLIGEQHEEVKDVRDQTLGVPADTNNTRW